MSEDKSFPWSNRWTLCGCMTVSTYPTDSWECEVPGVCVQTSPSIAIVSFSLQWHKLDTFSCCCCSSSSSSSSSSFSSSTLCNTNVISIRHPSSWICPDNLFSCAWILLIWGWSWSCLNWMVSLQVLPCPQLIFSFQNLVFWNLFEFSVSEITLKSISPTFWIQILPNKFH